MTKSKLSVVQLKKPRRISPKASLEKEIKKTKVEVAKLRFKLASELLVRHKIEKADATTQQIFDYASDGSTRPSSTKLSWDPSVQKFAIVVCENGWKSDETFEPLKISDVKLLKYSKFVDSLLDDAFEQKYPSQLPF